ncbi:tetratricopeptide repeat protein [Nostoc sp.]|uniref:tetratricopeptide repeat protein n=1 Tax=Nostoc sp. TaxID=1180 RepID=UPI002FF6E5B6
MSPTIAPTFTPIFAPTFAPTLSLIGRVDFFFEAQEVSLIKINIGDKKDSFVSPALECYKLGVEKAQQEKADYKGAVKYYSDALSKDGKFAEAHVSRGRAYSELGDHERAIKDYTMAMNVSPKFAEDNDRYVEPLLGRGTVYIKLR